MWVFSNGDFIVREEGNNQFERKGLCKSFCTRLCICKGRLGFRYYFWKWTYVIQLLMQSILTNTSIKTAYHLDVVRATKIAYLKVCTKINALLLIFLGILCCLFSFLRNSYIFWQNLELNFYLLKPNFSKTITTTKII